MMILMIIDDVARYYCCDGDDGVQWFGCVCIIDVLMESDIVRVCTMVLFIILSLLMMLL